MNRHALIPVLIFSSAVVLSACSSGPQGGPYVPVTRANNQAPYQHSQRIVVMDRQVLNVLLYVNSVQQRLPGGQLMIQANFQNRLNEDIWVEAKTEFLDSNNIAIDASEWVETHFAPYGVTAIRANSMAPAAAKHTLLLRNIRNVSGVLPRGQQGVYSVPGSAYPVPN